MERDNKRVESARADMQRLAKRNESSILRNLEKYVRSRQETYEAFRRMDPTSSQTSDARALLEKARSDLAIFKERFNKESNSPDANDDPAEEARSRSE